MVWQDTRRRTTISWPVAPAFLVGLLLLSLVLVGLIQAGVFVYAYQRIGISPTWLLGLLALSMLGAPSTCRWPACPPRSSVPPAW